MKTNKAQSVANLTSEMSHTPTPWNIEDFQELVNGNNLNLNSNNRLFIIRAVNQHDQLVSENAAMRLAHDELVTELKLTANWLRELAQYGSVNERVGLGCKNVAYAIEKVIAKAKGR